MTGVLDYRNVFCGQYERSVLFGKRKKGWFSSLLDYAQGSKGKRMISVILSVVSVVSGVLPYYCIFRLLEAYIVDRLDMHLILYWCGMALAAYIIKVVFFGLSTGLSHYVAYHILEKLRLKELDILAFHWSVFWHLLSLTGTWHLLP